MSTTNETILALLTEIKGDIKTTQERLSILEQTEKIDLKKSAKIYKSSKTSTAKKAAKQKEVEVVDLSKLEVKAYPYKKEGAINSFAVIGETKPIKSILSEHKARYNWKIKGWFVSKKSAESLFPVLDETVKFTAYKTAKTFDDLCNEE